MSQEHRSHHRRYPHLARIVLCAGLAIAGATALDAGRYARADDRPFPVRLKTRHATGTVTHSKMPPGTVTTGQSAASGDEIPTCTTNLTRQLR
ncbi:hypothetical protein, partial [Staphylococcus epidermidis]|uniref:hypothetical protein n=1 Tax=Staphylococcus epidermidis TaxID=1282 RepID=UPI00115D526A